MSSPRKLTLTVAYAVLVVALAILAGSDQTSVLGNPAPLVCLTLTSNLCPSTPPMFTGQKGSILTVYIVAQGVGSFQKFTISVKTNASTLDPLSISVIGSVLESNVPVGSLVCINGSGLGTCGPQDGPGVVSVTGWGYYATTAPTNGMIFSIRYSVVGSGSNVPMIFPSGCSSSSVSGGICVDLNGPTVSVQTASFGNLLSSTGDFRMSSNTTSVSLARGMMGNFRITFTGSSGFYGTIILSATSPSYAISVWLSSDVVSLQINDTPSSDLNVLSLASIAPGNYNITVTASSGNISHSLALVMDIFSQEAVNAVQNGNFSSGLADWTIGSTYQISYGLPPRNYPIVQVTNATWSCTPGVLHGAQFLDIWNQIGSAGYAQESVSVPRGGAMLAFLSWAWITSGSESASVSVGSSVLDTFVPALSINSTSACTENLPSMKVYDISNYAGESVDVRLSAEAYSCCRSDVLFYDVLVVPKGSGGLRDFTISASPESLTVPRTTNGTFTVAITSLNGFGTSVNLTATVVPASPMWPNQVPLVVLNRETVVVAKGETRTVNGRFETNSSTLASSYAITIVADSSRMEATTTVTANVPSVAMAYEISSPEQVQAGDVMIIRANLTNLGYLPSRIILVTATSNFGRLTLLDASHCPGDTPTMQLGNSLCDIPTAPQIAPVASLSLSWTFTVPSTAEAGSHTLSVAIEWQYRNPFPIIWEDGNMIVATSDLTISANPTSTPTPSPSPKSTPHSSSTLAGELGSMVKSYGLIILVVNVVGAFAVLVVVAILRRRPRPSPFTVP